MTPRAVANQAVDKQIAKHYEELQQHGAAEPRLAPAWPEPAVAPPEPAANDQPGRSPIPSEGGEGLPSSAPDDGGWGELGRAADEGARADALMRRRKLQQWQAEVTKLGGTAKIEEQEFEDGKGSKKPAVHFELPTLAEIGICATIGCQRVKQYPEGFDWDCCCKGCFATDGQHHEVGAATDELKSLPLYGEELEDGGQYTVVLCRIWIDSANYSGGSKSAPDSVIVFLWNFVTQNAEFKSRRIITVIRKKDCCSSCGCSGRCSTDRIKEVINWDFENLRLGRRQTVNSRGQALSADRVAAATAKPQRLVKGLLREAGLDIMELGHSFNLRAMSSKERPCVKCFASGENMYDFTIDHRRASSDTYMAEVDAQTVKRCVSRPEAAQIQTALVCDLRKDGLRGRALAWDCAGFKWGDRLEASGSIIDSRMDLRLLHPFPAEIVMWRSRADSCAHARCPLLMGELSPQGLLGDWMHTFDLGLAAYCAGETFGVLICTDMYRTEGPTQDVRIKQSIARMHDRLKTWRDAKGHSVSFGSLTQHMVLGSSGLHRPVVNAKAIESKYLFKFAVAELKSFYPQLLALDAARAVQAKRLMEAANLLESIYDICKDHGRKLPGDKCRRLLAAVRTHNALMQAAGCSLVQKHHWAYEMIRDCEVAGNPFRYSNYPDEDFNSTISAICRVVHGRNFALGVLKRYRIFCISTGVQY